MKKLKVLILEDFPLDAELVCAGLTSAGWECDFAIARSRDEYLEGLGNLEDCPDLILADYKLPDFDGLQALAIARQKCPEVPFIFVSGTLGEEHAIESLKQGATDYVLKQRPERLIPAVARAVRESQERAERRAIEDQLRATGEILRGWFTVSPQAMIAVDEEGCVKMWSPAAERLLGKSAAEVIDKPFPEGMGILREYILSALVGRDQRRVEVALTSPDGLPLDLSVWMTALGSEPGRRATGVVAVMEDITERKRVEDELRGANRAKDHFLAVLSHELRTPLTPVLATLEGLEEQDHLPGDVRDDLRLIQRNVELEARLIDDLLDLTRISKGKLELNIETANLHSLLQAAVDICAPAIHEKQQKVKMDLHAQQQWVRGDPARLQQVFWNLVKNAVKFTPKGGQITISTENIDPGMVSVRVIDTGIGIDSKGLGKIFEAFEQGSRRMSRQFGGLGLGLTISRALVELHGGWLEASSAGPGKGATFTVKLGTVATPVNHVGSSDGRDGNGRARAKGVRMRALRILLVEDHTDTAQVMIRLLQKLGHEVHRAASIADGGAMWRELAPDLLISDIGLPDGTGVELLERLRSESPGRVVRAIALSGFGMQADIERSRAAGFEEHLTKPLNIARLEGVLRQMFAGEVAGR